MNTQAVPSLFAAPLKLSTAVLLLGLFLSACGDDQGPITEMKSGDFTYSPSSINFQQVAVGDSFTEFLRVSNHGEHTVTLSDLRLQNGDRGTAQAFSVINAWEGRYELEPDSTLALEIRYAPTEAIRYSGILSFKTNVPDNAEVNIPISTATPRPELFTTPESVAFTRTPPGASDWRRLDIRNIGYADLEIESISISGDSEFSISYPYLTDTGLGPATQDASNPPSTVKPNEFFPIRVTFDAVDDQFRSAIISIKSNDPNQAVYPVVVTANSNAPCLEVEHDEVDFGYASIGNTTRNTVTLINCSDVAETVITSVQLTDDADGVFAIDSSYLPGHLAEGGNAVLGPNEVASFPISYAPKEERADQGTLLIRSNDAARTAIEVPIKGQGSNFECPISVAEGRIIGTTRWEDDTILAVPLDEVEFTAEQSYDPDETDLSYQWTILQRPLGSGAYLEPNTNAKNPTMLVDIAGIYVIELTVFDEYGIASCEPSQVRIEAHPNSDIHVELTWEVPSSSLKTGTDIDLHYLHPDGEFGHFYRLSMNSTWEIFYNNPGPQDWGGGESVSLDIDDRNGDKPENINHRNPTSGNTYSVGVYYYSDPSNYGVTEATIRVFLAGQLVSEMTQRLENAGGSSGSGDFWHVLDIPWDGIELNVEPVDIVHSGFPGL